MDLSIDCDEFSCKANSRGVITVQLEDIDKLDLNNEDVAKCIEFSTYFSAYDPEDIRKWMYENYTFDDN